MTVAPVVLRRPAVRGDSSVLDGVEALVCDLDGVVYLRDEAIVGVPQALARLRAGGIRLVFCTNNAYRTAAQYRQTLHSMGIEAREDEVISSATVAAEVLEARGLAGGRAYVVGGDGLKDAIASIGMEIDENPDARGADLVIVGFCPHLDYSMLRRAATEARRGAAFVVTNDDPTYPGPDEPWPGTGAVTAAIEVASGRTAERMGKPSRPMMEAAARRLAAVSRIAMVGDRAASDLAGAEQMGWVKVLVLSGSTGRDELDGLEPEPDLVLESLAALG